MVEKTKKTVQPRARIAHKLARYVRANPVHHQPGSSAQRPSVTHLSIEWVDIALGGAPQRKHRNSDKTWYPADDEKNLFKRRRNQPKPSTGRKSIVPGSVVILLSGPHRGRRVVVLKHLEAGNILVTGPYAINGVPLKRVNAAHVISTSTRVPLDGVSVNIDNTYFKKQVHFTKNQLKNASETRTKHAEEGKNAEAQWRAQAKATQKTVDAALIANIKKVEQLSGYLATRFTLAGGVRPHELRFWCSLFKTLTNHYIKPILLNEHCLTP